MTTKAHSRLSRPLLKLLKASATFLLAGCSLTQPDDSRNEFPIVFQDLSAIKVIHVKGWSTRLVYEPVTAVVSVNCSLDGTQLAYSELPMPPKMGPSITHLFVVRTDGTGRREVTVPGMQLGPAAWSANGSKLALPYVITATSERGIAIINTDGSDFIKLAGTSFIPPASGGTGADYKTISWSPDGTEVVYSADAVIYAVNVGTGATRVVAQRGIKPRWSPDGTQIAFVGFETGPQLENALVVVDRNGGSRRVVVPATQGLSSFTWSRDGTQFIYEVGLQLMRVSASGGLPTPFADLTVRGRDPHWCGTP